jgi:hypothetical protein
MMPVDTDRIRKTAFLQAPVERVWAAISDAREFGTWFGAEFEGPFVAGARVGARIVPTKVDAEVAKLQEPHAGTAFEVIVERWSPCGGVVPLAPYPVEKEQQATAPMTLWSSSSPRPRMARGDDHESGFDLVPLDKRADASKATRRMDASSAAARDAPRAASADGRVTDRGDETFASAAPMFTVLGDDALYLITRLCEEGPCRSGADRRHRSHAAGRDQAPASSVTPDWPRRPFGWSSAGAWNRGGCAKSVSGSVRSPRVIEPSGD